MIPVDVGLLSPQAVMLHPKDVAHLTEEFGACAGFYHPSRVYPALLRMNTCWVASKNLMNDYSDYPHEYVASRFRDWVYVVTGTAIIRAQYVERVLNGICLLLGTQGLKYSPADFLSGDASRTRQTLGMIERQLRNTRLFDPNFSERLQVFTHRRNRIVHGLYADSFHSHDDIDINSPVAQEYVKECEWLVQEAPRLVEIGFGIYRVLGNLLKPDHSEYAEIVAALRGFDEFYERGFGTIAPELKPHFDQQTL